jgi:uncharacterized protein (TIGR04255 family)
MVAIKFTNPPVVEVLLGIQLENIGFSLIHFGLYWQTIQARFPLHIDQPVMLLEEDEDLQIPGVARALFMSSDNKKVIHLQNNFFGFSVKHSNEYKYPHFEQIFTGFMEEWGHFQEWYKEQKIEESLKPCRYELTYVNLLDKDVGWNSPADNHQIFTFLNSSSGDFLKNPYSQSARVTFSLPNEDEALLVEIDHRVSEEKNSDFLIFRLTIISFDTSKDVTAWFPLAHIYMIRAFLDLTKTQARKMWGQLDE